MIIPTEIKKLRGNPGKQRLRPEPKFHKGALPEPPKMLTGLARDEWLRVSTEVYHLGLLTVADLNAFAAYCIAYEAWVEADRAARDKHGKIQFTLVSTNTGNLYVNPQYTIARTAAADMVKYAIEFGMTPASRSKIAVYMVKAEDELDDLLN